MNTVHVSSFSIGQLLTQLTKAVAEVEKEKPHKPEWMLNTDPDSCYQAGYLSGLKLAINWIENHTGVKTPKQANHFKGR